MPDANDILSGNAQPQSMAAASQSQSAQPGVQEPGGFFKKLLATILNGTAAGIEAGPSAFGAQGFSGGFNQAQANVGQYQQEQAQAAQQAQQQRLQQVQEARNQQSFQTSEQLKQQQLANSILQNRETSMRLDGMERDQADPLIKSAATHAEKAIENGDGQVIGTSEDINALEQQWQQVHANGGQFLDHEIVPINGGKEYALVKIVPHNTNESDETYTIPGNKDLGVPDKSLVRKAGTDANTWRVMSSGAFNEQAKAITEAGATKRTAMQQAGATEREKMKGSVSLQEQHMRAASAAGDKEAIALDKQISDLTKSRATLAAKRKGYVFDKNETQEEKDIDNQIGNLTKQLNDHMKQAQYPQEGKQVTLKDGRSVTIKHINPDGTFNY